MKGERARAHARRTLEFKVVYLYGWVLHPSRCPYCWVQLHLRGRVGVGDIAGVARPHLQWVDVAGRGG
jgi:hypothetical protein